MWLPFFLFHYISTMLRFIIFFVLNFSALGLGSLLMGGNPAANDWYQSINKAPWTPPGWVFGFAWTTIMICLTVFMWKLSEQYSTKELKLFYFIYALHWILNVLWNPVFFKYQYILLALIIILILTCIVGWFLVYGYNKISLWALFVLPYFLWLIIATSLNGYIFLRN
jgi:translocator protein